VSYRVIVPEAEAICNAFVCSNLARRLKTVINRTDGKLEDERKEDPSREFFRVFSRRRAREFAATSGDALSELSARSGAQSKFKTVY